MQHPNPALCRQGCSQAADQKHSLARGSPWPYRCRLADVVVAVAAATAEVAQEEGATVAVD